MVFCSGIAVLVVACICSLTYCLDNGLAERPPMGYSTWNSFGCNISEEKVKLVVHRLKKSGLRDLGYEYINIDDCWMRAARNEAKEIQATDAFPSGMRAVGDLMHGKGFKFGIYTSRGSKTCEGRAGSLGHEKEDAAMFANWGVDFLKNDGCYDNECFVDWQRSLDSSVWRCGSDNRKSVTDKYRRMRDALNASGRQILYEVCGWEPWYAPVGAELGNMFRIAADVRSWNDVYQTAQVMHQIGRNGKPGGWAHPDMLIGSSPQAKFQLTPEQSRAQFTLWAIFPAPLILSFDIIDFTVWDRQTYTNANVLGVNQDGLLRLATRVFDTCEHYPQITVSDDLSLYHIEGCHQDGKGGSFLQRNDVDIRCRDFREGQPFNLKRGAGQFCQQIWTKELEGGALAVAAVNFGKSKEELEIAFDALSWSAFNDVAAKPGTRVHVRDLWNNQTAVANEPADGSLRFSLKPSGGHALLRLSIS